MKFTVL